MRSPNIAGSSEPHSPPRRRRGRHAGGRVLRRVPVGDGRGRRGGRRRPGARAGTDRGRDRDHTGAARRTRATSASTSIGRLASRPSPTAGIQPLTAATASSADSRVSAPRSLPEGPRRARASVPTRRASFPPPSISPSHLRDTTTPFIGPGPGVARVRSSATGDPSADVADQAGSGGPARGRGRRRGDPVVPGRAVVGRSRRCRTRRWSRP